ncbi:hypothetical protein [Actinophytocola xanthii]|uniref:Uncharacterized protein n=1 Tax=Actinophytocola xanthii TaxID=1912961 RepID=A0A1Q8CYF3_9PSEU|nr:hypothetical protein [Actinophytocola xanthii]OLF19387.1 hypothetical protein BU204_00190 [Actinophytocola xanthii]
MTDTQSQETVRYNGFPSLAGPARENPPTPPRPEPRPLSFAPPSGPRRRTAVVLAVLTAVLLVGAGVAAGLYVGAADDRAVAEERLAQRQADLAEVRDRVASSDDQRERAEQAKTALENENAALTACVEAVQHYLWDEPVGAALTTALNTLFAECR